MSDLPERIWAYEGDSGRDWVSYNKTDWSEYIRADLLADALRLPEVRALVGAMRDCTHEGELYISATCGCENCEAVIAALAALGAK